MNRRPLIEQRFADTATAFFAACEADPLLESAVRRGVNTTDEREREMSLGFAADRLATLAPILPAVDWLALLTGPGHDEDVTLSAVPGIAGHTAWPVQDDAEAEALRTAIGPGQVWVRADLVRSDDWPTVRAFAADAAERMGKFRGSGRPRGPGYRAVVRSGAVPRSFASGVALSLGSIGATGLGAEDAGLCSYLLRLARWDGTGHRQPDELTIGLTLQVPHS